MYWKTNTSHEFYVRVSICFIFCPDASQFSVLFFVISKLNTIGLEPRVHSFVSGSFYDGVAVLLLVIQSNLLLSVLSFILHKWSGRNYIPLVCFCTDVTIKIEGSALYGVVSVHREKPPRKQSEMTLILQRRYSKDFSSQDISRMST